MEQTGLAAPPPVAAASPTLSILICTANRPEVLRRCLASIAASKVRPTEILVSDDSQDGRDVAAVCEDFPGVRYLRGPRRGLCANRNAVIRQATTDFVSLLDDDAVVSAEFIGGAFALIADLPPKTVLTGTVIETDQPTVAGNPSFLGFFGKPPNGTYKNINLNCNVFPRGAFATTHFDELILYGYEDMDVCSRLLSLGYTIRLAPDLVNTHLPPARTAAVTKQRFVLAERARFYTSVKRYMLWEQDVPKLLAYVVIAPAHRLLHAVKTGKWFDLLPAVTDMGFALRTTLRDRDRLLRGGPLPAPRA